MMPVYYLSEMTIKDEIIISVVRKDDDESVWILGDGVDDFEYLAWCDEGNVAEPWQPPVEEPVIEDAN